METRQRRSFTDYYNRQTVDLVASSSRSVGSVAKELGLRDSVLRRWVEQRGAARLEPGGGAAPHNAGDAAVGGPRGEIARCSERTSGCAWRDILRKSISIFAGVPK